MQPMRNNLGKHQIRLLEFIRRHPGPHTLTSNKGDPAHRALASLCRRGLAIRLQVGRTVMAEAPHNQQTPIDSKTMRATIAVLEAH